MDSVRTVDAGGKMIALARTADGYFAVNNRCPHAGAFLGEGYCEKGYLVCPVHRFRYDLKTGRGAPQQGDYVDTYPVKETDEGVFIGFEKKKWWFW